MATEEQRMREHMSGVHFNREQMRTTCPVCGPDRRKPNERSLSIKMDGDMAVYKCHHCEISGAVSIEEEIGEATKAQPEAQVAVVHPDTVELSEAQLSWLSSRGIRNETALRCGVVSGSIYIRSRGKSVPCVGFPYYNPDGTKAPKWRDGAKNFSQTGAARTLWRINDFSGGDLIICEGEMDSLAFEEAGIYATSVPNGAPASLSNDLNGSSTKYSYLWDNKDKIELASRVILATDADEPGQMLCEEIARRLGKGRCYRVQYPDDCKDVNDVLMKHGAEGVRSVLENATPWPVSGIRNVSEYRSAVMDLYENGVQSGAAVGVPEVDNLFRACPQTLTVCTGIPGSGKSAFLGWMSVQLAARSGWQVAVFSAEMATQIMLLHLSAAFIEKPYAGPDKMSEEELNRALDWIATKYVFLDEAKTDIDSILERAQAAVLRNGVRILLIDPYNFLTGLGGNNEDGIEKINRMLTSLKSFAVEHDIACWLVAHPVKMYRGHDGNVPVPTGYDVAGSASFFNVADSGITISRMGAGKSLLTSWKARYPWCGSLGDAELSFNPDTGVFAPTIRHDFQLPELEDDDEISFDAL